VMDSQFIILYVSQPVSFLLARSRLNTLLEHGKSAGQMVVELSRNTMSQNT